MKGMQLETAPSGVDPITQQKVRNGMLAWFVAMGHSTQFDDTATFRSYGDLKLVNRPTLRNYLMETVSVRALTAGSARHGTA